MPLSKKLKQDYAELADGLLGGVSSYIMSEDGIKEGVKTNGVLTGEPKDIIESLSSIIEPDGKHEVKKDLKEGIKSIQELLDSPEDYVQDERNYQEYNDIITDRIKSKISDLKNLTPEQEESKEDLANRKQQKEEFAQRSQKLRDGSLEATRTKEGIITPVSQQEADRQMALQLNNENTSNIPSGTAVTLDRNIPIPPNSEQYTSTQGDSMIEAAIRMRYGNNPDNDILYRGLDFASGTSLSNLEEGNRTAETILQQQQRNAGREERPVIGRFTAMINQYEQERTQDSGNNSRRI